MSRYDAAFWWSLFFLAGTALGSFSKSIEGCILVGFLATFVCGIIFFVFNERRFVIISSAILLGSFYYGFHESLVAHSVRIPFGSYAVMEGVVTNVAPGPDAEDRIIISLSLPYHGKIQATIPRYPIRRYGDVLEIRGTPKEPTDPYRIRLRKDGIFATISFPQIRLIGTGGGNSFFKLLARTKEFSKEAMHRILPLEKSAFLSGILLGETSEFNKEFREKLQKTGTSHIVALSGYNIAVVASSTLVFFGFWFSRRKAIIISVLFVIGFVLMTGAEASVVRAAIMAGILMLAESSRRLYSFRNAIVIAAVVMVLVNPKVLMWDLGFQLSFAAMLGIVYLRPAITLFFNSNPGRGFLGFRENFLNTISAEIAVFPIILMTFGTLPIIGVVVNLLVLAVIPSLMLLGFLIVVSSILSVYLALVFGFFAEILLGYAIFVITFFSRFAPEISLPNFGIVSAVISYVFLAAFIIFLRRKKRVYLDEKH